MFYPNRTLYMIDEANLDKSERDKVADYGYKNKWLFSRSIVGG